MSDYSSNFPTQSPTFAFDAKAGKLDSRLSYSRSSGGTYMSSEKALNSDNLLLQSQDFDTTWVPGSIATPTGSQTAPDGTSTAWLFSVVSGATVRAGIYQNWAPVANTEYTLITHLKAGTASHGYASMRTNSGDFYAGAVVDFSAGTISVTSAGMTSATGTVTALGSNWFRVTVTATSGTSLSSPQITIGVSDGTAVGTNGRPAWTAAGTETMYAWGAQLSSTNSKVYDSPTTTQISREYAPLLKTASADQPRFEYAADGQSEGLLIESQATNLVAHSADFDDSSWTKVRSEIDSSAAIAPDGSLTADYFRATSDSANGAYVAKSMSVSLNATVNVSLFHKKTGGDNYALITTYSGANGARQWFNLSTGGLGNSTDYGSGFSVLNAGVEEVGNGWLRLNVTVSCTGSNVGVAINPSVATDGGYANSVSTTNALIWGAMLTESSSPSSYIATTSSQVSRASDSCSVVDASLFDNGGGTIYAEASRNGLDTYNGIASVDDGSGSNIVQIFGNSNNFRAEIGSGGTTVANMMASGHSAGAYYKHCVAYSPSEAKYYVDGSQKGSTDTDLNIPSMSQMHFGMLNATTTGNLNGHIKRVALYNVALSDTELAALTS